MENSKLDISIIMPALNEQANIIDAIDDTNKAFDEYSINGEIIVMNDGSTDDTRRLVEEEMKSNSRVRLVNHEKPYGLGGSFWDGVDHANGGVILCIPGDNENDVPEILRYFKLLDHVDMVIPFVYNKEVRSLFRNGLSFLYRFIINSTFGVYLNYTNGTVLYRKSVLEKLEYRSSSFFFQTDILIRLLKRNYLFAEVPYRLDVRNVGESKAVSFPSLLQVVRGYLRLVKDIYGKSKSKAKIFPDDTMSAKRHNSD